MKKNISVNIFGTLYPIDEDAYELLQQYNKNMRLYYSHREGGEEIADDVEHRVAELLSELRSQGVEAITIEHVKTIIDRIGDPQQMDSDEGSTSNSEEFSNSYGADLGGNDLGSGPTNTSYYTSGQSTKKLFRDTEDKVLGGVISGVSHYFGLKDPLLLRVLMVFLLLMSFTTIAFIYVVAWILIPEAITPEDRLRMYGKPVSAKAINEELMRGVNSANQFVNNPQNRDTARGCLSAIVKFFAFCIGAFVIFILGSLLLALFAAVIGLSIAAIAGDFSFIHIGGMRWEIFEIINSMPKWLVLCGIICTLIVIGLPLYGAIRLLTHSKSTDPSMSTTTKVSLIAVWVISLFVLLAALGKAGINIHKTVQDIYKKEKTHDGIYLSGNGWKVLNSMGWKVESLSGVDEDVCEWGLLPNGYHDEYLALEAENNPNDMEYDFRQHRDLDPGTYKIDGYVKADGEGNSLYVITGNDTIKVKIPPYSITDMTSQKAPEDSNATEEVYIDSNDGRRMWTHVESTFEVKKPGTVMFGISNKKGLSNTPWSSRKVKIADVRIGSI